MRKHIIFAYLLSGFLLIFGGCKDNNTGPDDADPPQETGSEFENALAELETQLHPLQNTDPSSSTDDLAPLDNLADAQVIGLGEATHGTREFFQMKHKIFRYLVENHNVRVFAFEADMGESIYIDRYINGGPGDLTGIMAERMHFWTWYTEEVRDLLEWMRNYNEGKPEPERLHYIGVDSQYLTFQPDLIETYLEQTSPELLEEIRWALTVIRGVGTQAGGVSQCYQQMTPDRYESINDALNSLIEKMDENSEDLITASSYFDFHTNLRLAENLQQVHNHTYSFYQEQTPLRDQFMAENVQWLLTLLGADTKVAVWGHNSHISRSSHQMGWYLSNELGDQYKNIGFSFSKGSFMAIQQTTDGEFAGLTSHRINAEPLQNSSNGLFHSAGEPMFILNVEELSFSSELGFYLTAQRPFLMVGSVYNGNPVNYYTMLSLKSMFDAIIYIDETTPSVPLN